MRLSFCRFVTLLLLPGLVAQSDRRAVTGFKLNTPTTYQLQSLDEQALAERVRFVRHALRISGGLDDFFKATRIRTAVTADGTVVGGLFFAAEGGTSGGTRKPRRFVEDEPQLVKRNPYAQELKRLLYGPQVTAESIERRAALRKIGPDLERHVQRMLKNNHVRIAIFPLGSSLKGYAALQSDVEFTVGILEGHDRNPTDKQSQNVFSKAVRLLKVQGYRGEAMEYLTMFFNFSPGALVQLRAQFLKGIIDPARYFDHAAGDWWFVLFLPAAYAESSFLDNCRREFLEFLHLERASDVWSEIQFNYLQAVLPGDIDNTKPHLKRWAERWQGRSRVFGVPVFEKMRDIYCKNPWLPPVLSIALFAALRSYEVLEGPVLHNVFGPACTLTHSAALLVGITNSTVSICSRAIYRCRPSA